MGNDVFGRGKIVFRNAIISDKGTTREKKTLGYLWEVYFDWSWLLSIKMFVSHATKCGFGERKWGSLSRKDVFDKALWPSCSFRRNFLAGFSPTSNSRYEGPNEILMGFLRLDRRRTEGAKRLHNITRIRFIPNRSLEHLSIKHYDLGSCGLL